MNGDTLPKDRSATCSTCSCKVTPQGWYLCQRENCPMNWPPGRAEVAGPGIIESTSAAEPNPFLQAARANPCPNDTDGDGDCHLCHGKPGACKHPSQLSAQGEVGERDFTGAEN